MIGNDLVDLQLANQESNWKRPRFLQKIFTAKEQDFIAGTTQKDKAIWLLWSRKESVYKIVARMKKRRFYAPKKLENTKFDLEETLGFAQSSGQITFEGTLFFTKSVVTNTYIHTVAQWNDKQPLISTCFYLHQSDYSHQHEITRQNLVKDYAQRTNLAVADLNIQKDEWKIPYIYHKNKRQSVTISISHHGSYGGYVFQ